jgi:hypothetical protein
MIQKLEDPERPLPWKSARMSDHSLTTGISHTCAAMSRSTSSCSPLIMEVICDVMKSCRSCADFGPPFSFLGRRWSRSALTILELLCKLSVAMSATFSWSSPRVEGLRYYFFYLSRVYPNGYMAVVYLLFLQEQMKDIIIEVKSLT